MSRRIGLIDIPAREEIKESRVNGIMNNGIDNAYPTRMNRIIERSVTAKACADMLARFLVGGGFVDERLNNIIVGRDNYRDITALKLLNKMAKSLSRHNGFFVRAQFNAALETVGFKFEEFAHCRLSKVDDLDYSGKIVVYNNWDRSVGSKIMKNKFVLVDSWNPRKDVLSKQINGNIESYKGQMFFNFFDDDYLYPLSPIDPAEYDADTEAQISAFKNGELRRGFFLKYIMHHNRFESEEEALEFMHKLKQFNGGDHEASMMVLEGTFDSEGKLIKEENIAIEKIEQNINDKLFETYESSTANSIRKSFDAIPQVLIEYQDSQLGTTSGEAIRQAADYYNKQTINKRLFLEQSFKELFANFKNKDLQNADWTIKPLTFE